MEWIKCSDRLPISDSSDPYKSAMVILFRPHGQIDVGWYQMDTKKWYHLYAREMYAEFNQRYVGEEYEPTHWMPFPNEPYLNPETDEYETRQYKEKLNGMD